MMAIVAVLGGAFSRNGYARRIAAAAAIAGAIRILGVVMETASGSAWILNILQYAVPLAAIWVCLNMIRKYDGKGLAVRQRAQVPAGDRHALRPL